MPTTLTDIPETITAGDSYAITLSLADYPATSGWSVSFVLAGPSKLTASATPDGAAHNLALSATATGNLAAGLYQWVLKATSGATVETFSRGTLTVARDLADVAPGEVQSYAEKMLTVCRTARENILRGEMKLYMIGGRQVQLLSLAEVEREEAYWRRELARERRGGSAFGSVKVAFTR